MIRYLLFSITPARWVCSIFRDECKFCSRPYRSISLERATSGPLVVPRSPKSCSKAKETKGCITLLQGVAGKDKRTKPLRRSQVTSNGVSLLVNWVIFDVTRRCPVAQRPNHLASGGLAPGTSHNTLKINSLRSYDHSATPCLRWRSGGPTRRPKKRALPVCANCLAKIVSNPQIR